MGTKSEERTGMKQVELSEPEWKQRAELHARLTLERTALEEKKATHNREWNEQLRQYETDINVVAEEVDTRMAWVPAQTDMFGAEVAANDDEPEEEETPRRRRRRARAAEAPANDALEA